MIELRETGELRDPVVIAAFEGWNDAGESASALVEHLATVWNAEVVAAVDPEDYYDFQVNRPQTVRVDGRRTVRWPTTRILLAQDTPMGRDVLLVMGIEPSVRWRSFAGDILGYAVHQGAQMMVLLGALLADVPHTRPIPVSVSSDDPDLLASLEGIEPSTYEGPTGIVGVLADEAQHVDLPVLSCWAAVPHYAGGPPSPKASLALLGRVEELLDCVIDDSALAEEARAWEHGVDELAATDDEVAEYVRQLEDAQDTVELPEASGDAIAREFERYLRRRNDGTTSS
ncbi:filament polymerization regulator ParJ [Ornithinimicrobium humiphilum]|uniref:Putative ATP-grasp superfamily ATP-dependent carboligase n=1 Tax=Ornithinimicrobium humiphilum TaxID=125288 RepID=A0A543KP88_9MICO|nr:PAC2 family protein [Ornithinimicrobium humiphilum]TQM96888.1 putative ATP-grasp superfamily ATP-dependent carboligase [Ornithinimicrobium humiphilum]